MNTVTTYAITDLIKPLDEIARSSPDKTLGSVLSQVNSSHSAVFVFDNKNQFVGLISPQKTLYSSNYPYSTKISSILFKPPTITKNTPLYEVTKHMHATRIYSLPIFTAEGLVEGVIHAKDILNYIINIADVLQFIGSVIKPHHPITAHRNSTVKDIYHLMRGKRISRVILVDDERDLAGIVSRSDLMHAFTKPTPKRRFPKEGTYIGFYSLAGEKKFRKEESIRKYYTALVDLMPVNTQKEKIVTHLIASPHNSIVLVDRSNKPTGFLSTHDLLQAVSLLRPEEEVPLIMKNPSYSVSSNELELAKEYLTQFGKKLKKRMTIEKIEVAAEESKNPTEQTIEFNTTLIVTPTTGKSLVAVTKQRGFLDGIQEATTLIEKQRRRKEGSRRADTRRPSSLV